MGGSQPGQTGGGVHIVALRIFAITLFYAEAFGFIFFGSRVAQTYNLLRLYFTSCECNALHVYCLRSQTMCAASVSAVGAGCDPGTHLAAAAALAT